MSAKIGVRLVRKRGASRFSLRSSAILGTAVAMAPLLANSQANAQCTTSGLAAGQPQNGQVFFFGPDPGKALTGVPLAAQTLSGPTAGVLVSAVNTLSTTFQSQSSSFVSTVGDPGPDATGGGVWTRGVGGSTKTNTTNTSNVNAFPGLAPGGGSFNGSEICNSTTKLNYGGFQAGADLARYNYLGNDIVLGVVGGYVEANARDVTRGVYPTGLFNSQQMDQIIAQAASNPAAQASLQAAKALNPNQPVTTAPAFSANVQVPFAGGYIALFRGNFFADTQVLASQYRMSVTDPTAGLFSQHFNAASVTVNASVGYRVALPNQWFIEPLATFSYSHVTVDPLFTGGTLPLVNAPSFSPPTVLQINSFDSITGRLGARVGTSFSTGQIVLQPFATADIWHEFAGNVQTSIFSNAFAGSTSFTSQLDVKSTASTTRLGTYGVFGIGMAFAVVDTGWLGYGRAEVREGSDVHGYGVNLGLRYQFAQAGASPSPAPARGIYKAPPPAPAPSTYDWSGFYVGGFAGGTFGHNDWNLAPSGAGSSAPRVAGALAGGTVGYNFQAGPWVYGVEADLGWTNANGGAACSAAQGTAATTADGFAQFFWTCNQRLKYLSTAVARFGYAWDRLLVYGKAGAAFTKDEDTETCNTDNQLIFGGGTWLGLPPLFRSCSGVNPQPSPRPGLPFDSGPGSDNLLLGLNRVTTTTASANRVGWTLGVGFQYALSSNWSAKAEYDYAGFGTHSVTFSDGSTVRVQDALSAVKVGLNYKLAPGITGAN